MHAEMFRQLHDDSIDPNDVKLVWGKYEDEINQHGNMANSYIQAIIDALKLKFGNRYTDLQYEAIAWNGLGNVNNEGVNTSSWNKLDENRKNELINAFASVNENCSEDECQ